MNKRQEFLDQFLNKDSAVQVYPAEVLSLDGDACTVRLLATGLEVEGVRLQANPDSDQRLVLRPAVGSTVLVGCVENEVSNLYVAQCSEISSFDLWIGDLKIGGNDKQVAVLTRDCSLNIEPTKLEIVQGGTRVLLENKRVKITNGTVSLKGLFDDLTTLLNSLIVLTPSGPSTGLGPNSITAVAQLTAKANQLLA